jgi:enamine deaminase RidA (YjgF/YER057c/UK114 family)
MTQRIAIFPAGRRELYERNKYSAAVASGGFLFVSGQVGSEEDGSPHADPEQLLRRAFANLNSVLAAAGCTFADVVDFTVFIVDPEKLMPVFL